MTSIYGSATITMNVAMTINVSHCSRSARASWTMEFLAPSITISTRAGIVLFAFVLSVRRQGLPKPAVASSSAQHCSNARIGYCTLGTCVFSVQRQDLLKPAVADSSAQHCSNARIVFTTTPCAQRTTCVSAGIVSPDSAVTALLTITVPATMLFCPFLYPSPLPL